MNSNQHDTKMVTIKVNGSSHQVPKGKISYDELVRLAFGTAGPGYTVTYPRGNSDQIGTVAEGQSVEVHEGMTFDVDQTVES